MDVQQRIVKPQHDVVQELSRKKGCDKNVEFDLKIKIIPFLSNCCIVNYLRL